MSAWPEATTVERFLVRVRRRMLLLRAVEGLASGLGVAIVLTLVGVHSNTILVAVVAALVAIRVTLGDQWRVGWWRSLTHVAERLERRTHKPRNLLVTASELSGGTRGYVHDAVMDRAAQVTSALNVGELFPATTAIGATAITAVILRAPESPGANAKRQTPSPAPSRAHASTR